MEYEIPVQPAQSVPKRREPRLPATLTVLALGIDAGGKPFRQEVTTVDISPSGARITGLTAQLKVADIIGLQSSGSKNRFRVAWIIGNRDGSFNAGLECMEKGGGPWRERLVRPTEGDDRRADERYVCNGSASLRSSNSPSPIWGTLRDVSASGCYLQSVNVMPEGEILSGQFNIQGVQVNALVEVRSSLHAVGMGLLWCDLGCDGEAKLNRLLSSLAINHIDAKVGKAKAYSQLNKLHQLIAAVRERLDSEHVVVQAETIEVLSEAQEKLTAALKSVQP